MYSSETGGRISEESEFGIDPLKTNPEKSEIRRRSFMEVYPSFNDIFSNVINSNSLMFQDALLFYISTTYRLSNS